MTCYSYRCAFFSWFRLESGRSYNIYSDFATCVCVFVYVTGFQLAVEPKEPKDNGKKKKKQKKSEAMAAARCVSCCVTKHVTAFFYLRIILI